MSEPVAHIIASSNAADLGLMALADLAQAARGTDYRVVGGHMVHLLTYVYPTPGVIARVTSDADVGIDRPTATGLDLHHALLERGYRGESGNRYVKAVHGLDDPLAVDILIPQTDGTGRAVTEELAGRGFDAIPGLLLALSCAAVDVRVEAQLQDGSRRGFTVPIPDVEAALILKAAAWRARMADKDVADIAALLEIVQAHRDALATQWLLADPKWARRGQRLDAARALYTLAERLERKTVTVAGYAAPRLHAIINRHVLRPR